MSRSLAELTDLVSEVSDTYASRNDIARDDDWYILKVQEELGELVAEYLKTTGRGRPKGADAGDYPAGAGRRSSRRSGHAAALCTQQ